MTVIIRPGQRVINPGVWVSSRAVVSGGGFDKTSLVSWWTLNETSGTRYDSHGTNHLTEASKNPTGQSVAYAAGKQGNCIDLENNGWTTSQYLYIPDNASLSIAGSAFTIGAWTKLETIAGYSHNPAIGSKWEFGSGIREWHLWQFGPNFYFYVRKADNSGSVSVNSTVSLSTGTWYFVVAWYDPGVGIYLQVDNGTIYSTLTATPLAGDGGQAFAIGESTSAAVTNQGYDGLIDEFFLFKRVLTSDERTALYNSGSGVTYSSL